MKPVTFDLEIAFSTATKYFTDLPSSVNPIPANSIIHKTVTGLGATYSEIVADRNSIIMLPHVNIIESKHEFHKDKHNTFPVYSKISKEDVLDYLMNCPGNKKFLSTPRGIDKIKWAVNKLGKDIYEEYFILIDECHKLISDTKYRDDMIPPMDDFFSFQGKAMISATPIPPSDPRFQQQAFKNIKVYPEYDYNKDIQLVQANSVINALKDIVTHDDSLPYYIFFNSINGVESIVKQLNIADESILFCSKENEKLLNQDPFIQIESIFEASKAKRFNFFTSSFYNGLDIILKEKPYLILISDVGHAEYTILDPFTDVLQILGRLRNGYHKAVHINNCKRWTHPITENIALKRIEFSETIHNFIQTLKQTHTGDPEAANILEEYIQRNSPYFNLLDENDIFSHFKKDNYLNENRIKCYYTNSRSLKQAYLATNLFNLSEGTIEFDKSEIEKLSRSIKKYSKVNIKKFSDILDQLEIICLTDEYDQYREEIKLVLPVVYEAYNRLGIIEIYKLEFSIKKIRKALILLDVEEKKNSNAFIELVYIEFKLNQGYLSAKIKETLQTLYDSLGIQATAIATDIEKFFHFKTYNKAIRGKSNRAYIFTGHKLNTLKHYQRE